MVVERHIEFYHDKEGRVSANRATFQCRPGNPQETSIGVCKTMTRWNRISSALGYRIAPK